MNSAMALSGYKTIETFGVKIGAVGTFVPRWLKHTQGVPGYNNTKPRLREVGDPRNWHVFPNSLDV